MHHCPSFCLLAGNYCRRFATGGLAARKGFRSRASATAAFWALMCFRFALDLGAPCFALAALGCLPPLVIFSAFQLDLCQYGGPVWCRVSGLAVMVFAEFVQLAVDVLPLLPVALCNYLTPFLLALRRKLHGPSSVAFSGTLLTMLAQALKVLSLTLCLWLLTGR